MGLTIKSLGTIKAAGGIYQRIGEAFDDVVTGLSNLARPLGTDLNGADVVPANISGLQAQHMGNGLVNVSITDNSNIVRGINYHVEYAPAGPTGDPDWTNPQGFTLGPWRTGTATIPNGTYFLRAYSQNPAGGPPSKPVLAQGPIQVSGSSTQTLFPSQASGTGKPFTGGGHGAGKTVSRN